VQAHKRQYGTFSLRLLFVSAVRSGAVVINLGFSVEVMQGLLGILKSLACYEWVDMGRA